MTILNVQAGPDKVSMNQFNKNVVVFFFSSLVPYLLENFLWPTSKSGKPPAV